MTQKDIFDLLKDNPLAVDVHVGDLEDLNGKDYIFLDFLNEELIGSDNLGCYQTFIQITICTKEWLDRKTLANYVKKLFGVSITYENSQTFQYYVAKCEFGTILNG